MLGVTGKDVGVLGGRQTSGNEVKLARAEARTQQPESSDQCQNGAHTESEPRSQAPEPIEVYCGHLGWFWELQEGEVKSEGLKGIPNDARQ